MPPRTVPPSPGPRDAAGFSFVELMVVLAILSFAFTYAVIHLDGATDAARLTSAARQVGTTIEFLRGHAVQADRPVEMHIDLDHQKWHAEVPPRPTESEYGDLDPEEILATEDTYLPRGIRFEGIQYGSHDQKTSGVLVLTFRAGKAITPNGFMVRLISDYIVDPDRAAFSVEVSGLTGGVSYIPGYAPFQEVVPYESF